VVLINNGNVVVLRI